MTARSVAIRGLAGLPYFSCAVQNRGYTHRDLSVLGRFVEDEQVHLLLDIGRDDRVGEVRGRPPEGSPRSRAGPGPTG
jgi:hypothetical protein